MLSLWQMSLSASAVILLAALLRRFAGTRLPRRMYVAMWDVASLAFLVPFRMPLTALLRLIPKQASIMPASLGSAAVNLTAQQPPVTSLEAVSAVVGEIPVVPQAAATGLAEGSKLWDGFTGLTQSIQIAVRTAVQAAPGWLWQAAGIIWLAGAVVLAVMVLRRWLVCMRAFSEALPCRDARVDAFLQEHRLLRPIRVRLSGHVASPLSYGLWRPVILLPGALLDADDRTLTYVLTHEFMHIRAWDMLRKSALLFIVCLHWPNPLVWLMVRLCNRDMELMCDERVVHRLGGCKAYCLTLLDMEVQRSNLTMGTCFSVTGIEERIKVMKNRKHQGILSIALAFAIFLGAVAGAMTGIPLAGAENASPRIFFSHATWEASYAQYEPYGLGYDAARGLVTYNGQVVRYFEDMWPVDEQGKAGSCFMYEGGEVDVYGVREFPEYIQRNPDGSFDPSGTLVGLRLATQEEYDARTIRQEVISPMTAQTFLTAEDDPFAAAAIFVNPTPVALAPASPTPQPTYRLVSPTPMPTYSLAQSTPMPVAQVDAVEEAMPLEGDLQSMAAENKITVQWWTADEYREWMEEQRIALQELVATGASSWTPSTGWFTWTQEKADETMALYENILHAIEQGAFVSKMINGDDADLVFMRDLSGLSFSAAAATEIVPGSVKDAISVEDQSAVSVVEATPILGVVNTDEPDTILYGLGQVQGDDAQGAVTFISVGAGDERQFTPEEWAEIRTLLEHSGFQWKATTSSQQDLEMTLESYQTLRMEEWRQTIAPYAPFGLSFALDTVNDLIHLYWNGEEVRGIFDPQRGVWITEHAGTGYYPAGAKELIAVYENGALAGLRETDEEESAVWDRMRQDNAGR